MFKWIKKFLPSFLGITSLFADRGEIIKINEQVDVWYETFGLKEDPACLLIMGAGGPGMFWSSEFCNKLAEKGFYVIRYDQRDTGFSTRFDFAKDPYTLLDMAKDAIDLLDALHIKKAHLVGLSMGGPIAELISVHDSHRIQSLTLIATSSDFRPLNRCLAGLPPEEGALSSPQESYQQITQKLLRGPSATQEQQLLQHKELWKILNGSAVPLEEKKDQEEQKQLALRLKNSSLNHMFASRDSESLIRTVPSQVTIPTVILLGTEDPIFGPDHGKDLSEKIRGSKYYLVQRMGHVLHSSFSDFLIDKIVQNTQLK